jgi:hypothetical protein
MQAMSNVVNPEQFQEFRHKKLQKLMAEENMSEYVLTGGAFLDGLNSGVSIADMENCYMQSQDFLEFERKVWAEIYKIGKYK